MAEIRRLESKRQAVVEGGVYGRRCFDFPRFSFCPLRLAVFPSGVHENRPRSNQRRHRRLPRQRETHPCGLPRVPRGGRGPRHHTRALAGRLSAAGFDFQIAIRAEVPAGARSSGRGNPRRAAAGRLRGPPPSDESGQAIPQRRGVAGGRRNPPPHLENPAAHLRCLRRAPLLRTRLLE